MNPQSDLRFLLEMLLLSSDSRPADFVSGRFLSKVGGLGKSLQRRLLQTSSVLESSNSYQQLPGIKNGNYLERGRDSHKRTVGLGPVPEPSETQFFHQN